MISHSVEETNKIAKEWLAQLIPAAGATIVALNGNLGSGKTTFTQAVAKALGVIENITSPTFVIMKSYEVRGAHFKKLIHIDAYRLEDGSDLDALNLKEIMADPNNLVLIEWADNVKSGLPKGVKSIKFEYLEDNKRGITL